MGIDVSHILVINSSASGDSSVSRALVGDIVRGLMEAHSEVRLTCRDVDEDRIPHLHAGSVAGVRGLAESGEELATRALSDQLVAELQSADIIVIGAPMYNFSIPSTLRAWFDHVLRPRVTFAYSPTGPQGLLTGKRAIVVESRGGLYSEGPAQASDFQEPYLKQLLGFIGIVDVTFIHAEKIGFGPEARELALSSARAHIAQVVAGIATQAATAKEAA